MTDLTNKVLEKIQDEHLQPKPKWIFLLKDYVVWTFFGLSLLIGAMAFSVILFEVIEHDWEAYEYLNKSFTEYLLLSLPYLWALVTGLFGWVAYYYFKHTRKGYHLSVAAVLLASVLGSVILGTVFYSLDFGEEVDRQLAHNLPYYSHVVYRKKDIWSQPKAGFLGGTIIKIPAPGDILLEDFNDHEWNVNYSTSSSTGLAILKPGERIRIIGIRIATSTFQAQQIKSWACEKNCLLPPRPPKPPLYK